MRTEGSPNELEHRRRLAVPRVLDGYSTPEVADCLGVDPSSVRRSVAAFRGQGDEGRVARPVPGRPPKLTLIQAKILRRRLRDRPSEHGFDTELWTARRLAEAIGEEFGTWLNPKYLSAWLRDRGFSPQEPGRVPRERHPEAIAAGLESAWPRLPKKRGGRGPGSPGSPRAGCGGGRCSAAPGRRGGRRRRSLSGAATARRSRSRRRCG
jgi:transposase